MKRTIVPGAVGGEIERVFRHVFENGLGPVIELTEAPTTSGAQLASGEIGFYGTDLYWNIGGSTYKFTGTLV